MTITSFDKVRLLGAHVHVTHVQLDARPWFSA